MADTIIPFYPNNDWTAFVKFPYVVDGDVKTSYLNSGTGRAYVSQTDDPATRSPVDVTLDKTVAYVDKLKFKIHFESTVTLVTLLDGFFNEGDDLFIIISHPAGHEDVIPCVYTRVKTVTVTS